MSNDKQTRRQFLDNTGRGMAGALFVPLGVKLGSLPAEARDARPSAEAQKPTLVTIYLRGGADALNVVAPYADQDYYDLRPTIAIPAEDGEGGRGVVKLDERVGLHPALSGLKDLYAKGLLAPILNTGSPHPTRSHFDAQDFMEYAAPGDRTVRTGWMNRYLGATRSQGQSEMRGLALQPLLPRSLRGKDPVLAVPRLRRRESEGMLDLFDDVYRTGAGMGGQMGGGNETDPSAQRDEVVMVGRSTIDVLRRFWEIVERTPGAKKGIRYPRDYFGQQLATIARVIRAGCGLEVCGIDLTSWDHHQGEGSTDGAINRRLTILGQGLTAFFQDIGPLSERVTVLVMTEFGRNVAENGNRGTDHGHGSCMLALGGRVKGGRVIGSYGSLKPRHLYQNRDLQVDIDYRQVFLETLEGTFGFKTPKDFFPDWSPEKGIGLMKA